MNIVSVLPIGLAGGNVLIIFKGADISGCVTRLKPEHGVISFTILHETENTIMANLKIDHEIIILEIVELEIPIKYPVIVTAGKATMEFITERWRVDEFMTKMSENGITPEILRIGSVRMAALLTATQEKIVKVALANGFFEIPRGIELQELAGELGIGASSLSESLRRIFKKLTLNYEIDSYPRKGSEHIEPRQSR